MGERAWARLTIGGMVQKSQLQELIFDSNDVDDIEDIEELFDDERMIVIEDEEASYAQFSDLESQLVEAGIAFDRESNAVAEYGASLRQFRPGIGDFEHEVDGACWVVTVTEIRAQLAESPQVLLDFLNAKYPTLPKLEPITWLPEDAEVDAALGP